MYFPSRAFENILTNQIFLPEVQLSLRVKDKLIDLFLKMKFMKFFVLFRPQMNPYPIRYT